MNLGICGCCSSWSACTARHTAARRSPGLDCHISAPESSVPARMISYILTSLTTGSILRPLEKYTFLCIYHTF